MGVQPQIVVSALPSNVITPSSSAYIQLFFNKSDGDQLYGKKSNGTIFAIQSDIVSITGTSPIDVSPGPNVVISLLPQNDLLYGGTVRLTGSRYVRVFKGNMSLGDNDIYTPPVGKKALIFLNSRYYNPPGVSATLFQQLKIAGIYYRINFNRVLLSDGTFIEAINSMIVLNSSQTISMNVIGQAGPNCFFSAIEFDESNLLSSSITTQLSLGNNIIYTVPLNKTASILGAANSSICFNGAVSVANSTGGSLNYAFHNVPNGGVVDNTNKAAPIITINNLNQVVTNIPGSMQVGDSVVVVSPSAAAGQMAWVTYFETQTP